MQTIDTSKLKEALEKNIKFLQAIICTAELHGISIIKTVEKIPPEVIDALVEFIFKEWDRLPKTCSLGKGTKATLKTRLANYLSVFPEHLSKIKTATANYIEECVKLGRFAKYPCYFVIEQKSKPEDSMLYQAILNIEEEGKEQNDDLIKL